MQHLLPIIPVISLQIILKEEKQCVLFLSPPFDERPKFDLLCKLSKTHFASRSVQTRNFLPSPLPWKKNKQKTNNFKSEPHLPVTLRFSSTGHAETHTIIPPIGRAESNALMSYFPQEHVVCSHVSDSIWTFHVSCVLHGSLFKEPVLLSSSLSGSLVLKCSLNRPVVIKLRERRRGGGLISLCAFLLRPSSLFPNAL